MLVINTEGRPFMKMYLKKKTEEQRVSASGASRILKGKSGKGQKENHLARVDWGC